MSTKPTKGGRTPISQKEQESADFMSEDLDYNILKLDPELKAEIEAQGLTFRWLNAPKYLKGGNFHQSGWRAYRKKLSDSEKGSMDFNFGVSPEGYIIRNDLILGVKPKEQQERWKKHLRKKAQMQSYNNTDQKRASELRESAASQGVKAKIYEGYDENE